MENGVTFLLYQWWFWVGSICGLVTAACYFGEKVQQAKKRYSSRNKPRRTTRRTQDLRKLERDYQRAKARLEHERRAKRAYRVF